MVKFYRTNYYLSYKLVLAWLWQNKQRLKNLIKNDWKNFQVFLKILVKFYRINFYLSHRLVLAWFWQNKQKLKNLIKNGWKNFQVFLWKTRKDFLKLKFTKVLTGEKAAPFFIKYPQREGWVSRSLWCHYSCKPLIP